MIFTEIEEEDFLLGNRKTRLDLAYLSDCISEENQRILELIEKIEPNNPKYREKISTLYDQLLYALDIMVYIK
jgi:hypothetical protein